MIELDSDNTDPATISTVPTSDSAQPGHRIANSLVRIETAIIGTFILITIYTLYFAAPVLVPITLALLLNMLLTPAVQLLVDWRMPQPMAAGIVLLTVLFVLLGVIILLIAPAQEWLVRVPESFYKVEQKLHQFKKPMQQLQEATQQIEDATGFGSENLVQQVEVKRPGLTQILFSGTTQLFAALSMMTVLLFFLLASGETFLRKLVAVFPSLQDKKLAVEIVRSIQRDISFYLGTVTLINLALGVSVALATYLLGVENPLLWGTLAALLNFAPYVGALTNLVILTLVGMMTFDTLWDALLVPAVFAVLTISMSQILTPMILGKRLLLNPVAIFLAIIIWGWLWGIVGALLAVPLLASFKLICERFDRLRPIAEFLTP